MKRFNEGLRWQGPRNDLPKSKIRFNEEVNSTEKKIQQEVWKPSLSALFLNAQTQIFTMRTEKQFTSIMGGNKQTSALKNKEIGNIDQIHPL